MPKKIIQGQGSKIGIRPCFLPITLKKCKGKELAANLLHTCNIFIFGNYAARVTVDGFC